MKAIHVTVDELRERIERGDPEADLELIALLGARWQRLRVKYPDGREQDKSLSYAERAAGWVALAVGLSIEALAEEYYGGREQIKAVLAEGRRPGGRSGRSGP